MLNRSDLPIFLERKALPEDFPLQALAYTQQYRKSATLHYHDCVEIGRCIQGNGLLFAGGQIHSFGTDSVYVLPAGCVHDSGIIMTSPSEKPSIWQYLFVDAKQLGVSMDGFAMLSRRLLPLFEWLYALGTSRPERWQEEFIHLLHVLALEAERADAVCTVREDEQMLLMQHKIAVEYASDLTVEGLAHECSLSVSAFRKHFTAFVGSSPQQYLIQTRLQVARHLIINTDEKLISIAQKAGFRTLSSFNRLFLKHYGHSPRVLRKK